MCGATGHFLLGELLVRPSDLEKKNFNYGTCFLKTGIYQESLAGKPKY